LPISLNLGLLFLIQGSYARLLKYNQGNSKLYHLMPVYAISLPYSSAWPPVSKVMSKGIKKPQSSMRLKAKPSFGVFVETDLDIL